jgi:hypothetical protein
MTYDMSNPGALAGATGAWNTDAGQAGSQKDNPNPTQAQQSTDPAMRIAGLHATGREQMAEKGARVPELPAGAQAVALGGGVERLVHFADLGLKCGHRPRPDALAVSKQGRRR